MVEIIPKKQKKEPPWQKIAFKAALALLIAVVLGYLVLVYLGFRTSAKLQDLRGQITQVGTGQDRLAEVKVVSYDKKLKDFNKLLAERQSSVNFFENFETIIHPQVWFSEFQLDSALGEVTVSGHAANFLVLEQQITVFKAEKNIEAVDLAELSIGKEGEAKFTLILTLKPEFFIATE